MKLKPHKPPRVFTLDELERVESMIKLIEVEAALDGRERFIDSILKQRSILGCDLWRWRKKLGFQNRERKA